MKSKNESGFVILTFSLMIPIFIGFVLVFSRVFLGVRTKLIAQTICRTETQSVLKSLQKQMQLIFATNPRALSLQINAIQLKAKIAAALASANPASMALAAKLGIELQIVQAQQSAWYYNQLVLKKAADFIIQNSILNIQQKLQTQWSGLGRPIWTISGYILPIKTPQLSLQEMAPTLGNENLKFASVWKEKANPIFKEENTYTLRWQAQITPLNTAKKQEHLYWIDLQYLEKSEMSLSESCQSSAEIVKSGSQWVTSVDEGMLR